MQTFLPYKSFAESLSCLDNKRLGKQRVEARQIYNALLPSSKSGWKNHPAVKMWAEYIPALQHYHNLAIEIWVKRGFRNTMENLQITQKIVFPSWLTEDFCNAHRSNLLRKDHLHYSQFHWNVPDNLPYIWPTKQEGE